MNNTLQFLGLTVVFILIAFFSIGVIAALTTAGYSKILVALVFAFLFGVTPASITNATVNMYKK